MLIFLDLETTGVSESDKIVSVALLYEDSYLYNIVNEGKKIPPSASSVHHITNEMRKSAAPFSRSEVYDFLKSHNSQNTLLVVHNASFIRAFLSQAGVYWEGEMIDTERASKHLIEDCETYSLQYLRYELRLYKEEQAALEHYGIKDAIVAHNALSDAVVISLLYQQLLELATPDEILIMSSKNVLLQKLPFGKYAGKYIEEVCFSDRAYILWLLNNATDIDQDLKYSINYYLEGM